MRVLVLANLGMGLYKFRKELLENLIASNKEVFISLPHDDYVSKLESLGCKYEKITHLDRRGTNPLKDFKLILSYIRLIRRIKPDVVLTYTIKPNVYGGLACRITKTPYITNVTGLGTSLENKGVIQKLTLFLYKIGLKKASSVFFQNNTNLEFFYKEGIVNHNAKSIPGSGVNLSQHKLEEYPDEKKDIKFLFIGRIMKAKGIEELLQAAIKVKQLYPNVQFDLIGASEEDYSKKLIELENAGIVNYHGLQNDVLSFIKESHATILPSYHEGTANVLLESASTGRPILATRVPGCKETYDEGITGLGFDVKSADSLTEAIIKFIELSYKEKKDMGLSGRKKMEKEFDRKIVIKSYLTEIQNITSEENNHEFVRENSKSG
jgi:glycosyltransferase involved in cell wall biosynthesis